MTATWSFVKGHGTANDFVILVDGPDPTPEQVRALCDRRTGLGADGILRLGSGAGLVMDYRNADGSVVEMCGNGIRVFARWLVTSGQVEAGRILIQTMGGLRTVTVGDPEADLEVDMGPAVVAQPALVTINGIGREAMAVSMGNPHLVVPMQDGEVRAADLTVAPTVEPARPDGVNVELVATVGPDHLHMRVHERGVGETASCGTGACAAAVAAATWGDAGPDGREWTVDVPGGRLIVRWSQESVHLRGPAVLVAHGSVTL